MLITEKIAQAVLNASNWSAYNFRITNNRTHGEFTEENYRIVKGKPGELILAFHIRFESKRQLDENFLNRLLKSFAKLKLIPWKVSYDGPKWYIFACPNKEIIVSSSAIYEYCSELCGTDNPEVVLKMIPREWFEAEYRRSREWYEDVMIECDRPILITPRNNITIKWRR